MGSRGRESTAVRHESSAIRIVGGVSRSFGSVCDIVTPLHASIADIKAQLLSLSYVYLISSDGSSVIRIFVQINILEERAGL